MNVMAPRAAVSQAEMANAIRALAMDAVEKAKSGHPGMPMGMADVATVLFTKFLKFDPEAAHWPDRDRFVLSAGHGSMLLYALLHLTGYPDMTIDELKRFRQLGARTAGHPEYGHALGVETTTGPLGQGLATAVGMAIAEQALAARYPGLVDHHTYVIAGDGCLMEGVSHEAVDLAGRLRLSKLIVLWDDNRITIDGATSLSTDLDQRARFEAAGWRTLAVDGHDPTAIEAALAEARAQDRPTMIACRTVIGFGSPNKQGTEATHGAPLGAAEVEAARAALGWTSPPFEIPADILAAWRAAGSRSRDERRAWEEKLEGRPDRAKFEAAIAGDLPQGFAERITAFKRELVAKAPNVASRKASEMTLEVVNAALDTTLGGSADLTHSNLTITKGLRSLAAHDFSGRYVRYGVREFGMSAAMNGVALHGGFIPYGGTFFVFSDYARGAIRLSALMGLRVIYVLTHDFDRARRGRADASAGRTFRHAARDAEPACVPSLRRGRDSRMLGAGARLADRAFGVAAVAPEPADAQNVVRGQRQRPRRLRAERGRLGARRDAACDRFGSRARHASRRGPASRRKEGRRRLDAELGSVRGATG